MSNGIELLRMLEPITRPDGYGGNAQKPKEEALPIESRSFDSILQQVQQQAAGLTTDDSQQGMSLDVTRTQEASAPEASTQEAQPDGPSKTSPKNAMGPANLMTGLDQIESVSLRQWIGSLQSK